MTQSKTANQSISLRRPWYRPSLTTQILIGLESPSSGLDGLEHKANWKLKQRESYQRAIETIQDAGVTVNGCFVLGLDGDGPEVFEAVAEFVTESGLFDVQITVMTPFPGTPLYDRLLADGRLLEPEAWERCTMFDVNVRPAQMSPETLQHELVELGRRLYTTEQRTARRNAFYSHRRRFLREPS